MRDGPRHQSGACPESQGGEITCIRGRTEPPFCRRSACSWAALCSAHSLLHRPSRLRACQIPVSPTLANTEKILLALTQRVDVIAKSPAMKLTPETMGERVNASVASATGELHNL